MLDPLFLLHSRELFAAMLNNSMIYNVSISTNSPCCSDLIFLF